MWANSLHPSLITPAAMLCGAPDASTAHLARRALSGADAPAPPAGAAALHRQDAEQLLSPRAHPPDAAERPHHRCATLAARVLLFQLQAAFPDGLVVQLQP